MNPLITIITVVYNDVNSIEETILTVINQTYKNIEYIIIDGGSNDGTTDIIKKYEDRISYWSSEIDKGIYDAMNKGINKSNGEWIIFINAKDSFYSNDILSKINFNLEYDVIYGKTNIIYEHGNYILSPRSVKYLLKRMIFCHQSVFVKRRLLLLYPFDLEYQVASDYNLFYTLYTKNHYFKTENICIANFNAEDGLSAKNLALLLKENLAINKNISAYIAGMIRYKISQFVKFLIPSFYPTFIKFKDKLYMICTNGM
jgi:glycosyltransferase involved in cell wall biosynthesis